MSDEVEDGSQDLSQAFAALGERIRVAVEAASGFAIPVTEPVSDAELDRCERKRGLTFPADVRAFYRGIGHGVLAWFEVLEAVDKHGFDAHFREDLQEWREDGMFDDHYVEGDSPSLNSLVVAVDGVDFFIYDLDPSRNGRIVTYNAGEPGGRKSWTATASLLDFVRCVAEIAETGELVCVNPDIGKANPIEVDLERFRPILERNNATAAIFRDANNN